MSTWRNKRLSKVQDGIVVIYTGHGKGKTTAAFGMAFRALGRGMKVGIVQYIKGKWPTGERTFAEGLDGIDMFVMGKGFTWESDDISQDKKAAQAAWDKSRDLILTGEHPIVILDEITYAINYGWIEEEEVLATLQERPRHTTVVITGRNAPEVLMASADLISTMEATKHPYQKGRPALMG